MNNVITFPEKLCRVLVIDADPATTNEVRDALSQVSPRLRVYNAPDLATATPRLKRESWDLVVLKPWQAAPGKPLPIKVIRNAGYNGPVVPVTAGGPSLQRLPKAAGPEAQPSPRQTFRSGKRRAKTGASAPTTLPAMISQLLDESHTGT